jgi:hypothetical protein
VIDEEEVLVAVPVKIRAQERMALRVHLAVAAAAGRPVEASAQGVGVGIVDDEERLERDRGVVARHGGSAAVEALDLGPAAGARLGGLPSHLRLEGPVRAAELAHRLGDVAGLGEPLRVQPHLGEVRLDLEPSLRWM